MTHRRFDLRGVWPPCCTSTSSCSSRSVDGAAHPRDVRHHRRGGRDHQAAGLQPGLLQPVLGDRDGGRCRVHDLGRYRASAPRCSSPASGRCWPPPRCCWRRRRTRRARPSSRARSRWWPWCCSRIGLLDVAVVSLGATDYVHAVAARTLGPVHRPVRRLRPARRRDRGSRVADHPEERRAGHADAGGDPRRRLGDLAADSLGQPDGVSAGHRTRATTNSSPPMRATTESPRRCAAKDRADRDQGLVARRVPGGVVDPLEVVEVDHHDGQVRRAVPTRLGGQDAHRSLEARRLGRSVSGSMSDCNASMPRMCTSTCARRTAPREPIRRARSACSPPARRHRHARLGRRRRAPCRCRNCQGERQSRLVWKNAT